MKVFRSRKYRPVDPKAFAASSLCPLILYLALGSFRTSMALSDKNTHLQMKDPDREPVRRETQTKDRKS